MSGIFCKKKNKNKTNTHTQRHTHTETHTDTLLPDTFPQYCQSANNMQQQTIVKQNPNQTISQFSNVLFINQHEHPAATCLVDFLAFYNWLSHMSIIRLEPAECQRCSTSRGRGCTLQIPCVSVCVCCCVSVCECKCSRCMLKAKF